MSDSLQYTLAPFQDHFINSFDRRIAIVGAKGSSKTWSGSKFLLRQACDQPNEQHLMMLNTLQQARDIFYQDIVPDLDALNWPYHFNSQTMNLKVMGTTFHLRSAERDAIDRIESISYGSGWADEASFYNPDSFKIFMSRVRKGNKLLRATSMPADPDHWLYDILEAADFHIHEVSLYDNPDKGFVKDYENILKATYSDTELKRYLSGERLSLAGIGLFNVHPDMVQPIPMDPDSDIFLSWDFNVDYRAVSAWQKQGSTVEGLPRIACVASWQMEEATVYHDAIVLGEQFKDWGGNVILGGDATENKRSSQTTESIWQTVRRGFRESGCDIRNAVGDSNPSVKDTIQCCNWAFKAGLVAFDGKEKNVYRSLQACKSDKNGEIDKSVDNKKGGAKTHETDTARYAIWHYLEPSWPGSSSRIWAI